MCPKGGGGVILYWIMCVLHTGGKSEFLHRGEFIFLSRLFSKEGIIIHGFKVIILEQPENNEFTGNRNQKYPNNPLL